MLANIRHFFSNHTQFIDQHTFGWIGKQHQSTKAMNATIVPINRMKSSIVCGEFGKKTSNRYDLFIRCAFNAVIDQTKCTDLWILNALPAPRPAETIQMESDHRRASFCCVCFCCCWWLLILMLASVRAQNVPIKCSYSIRNCVLFPMHWPKPTQIIIHYFSPISNAMEAKTHNITVCAVCTFWIWHISYNRRRKIRLTCERCILMSLLKMPSGLAVDGKEDLCRRL